MLWAMQIAWALATSFPTESLSEDVCCSATFLGAGWKTAFIPEAVQYGSVPDSYLGHVKQRTRWVSNASGRPYVCVDLVYSSAMSRC
jgi:hypothetical protein